jgi:aminotransferase
MTTSSSPFLRYAEPSGIYGTLFAFQSAFGRPMGEPDTHPWSQGCPLTVQLPGGPELPSSIEVSSDDLKYPKPWGLPDLREAIARSYRDAYGTKVEAENVMVFAGGRPGLIAMMLFLEKDITIRVSETEYTPYYEILNSFQRKHTIVPSNPTNGFRPTVADLVGKSAEGRRMVMFSNPCNPTGHTRNGNELKTLVDAAAYGETGLLVDEAYEFFHKRAESALAHVNDLNESNLFVCGAATKGLQAPGLRIGWIVAAKRNIEVLGNFSSYAIGGVSAPSQRMAAAMLEPNRLLHARKAVAAYYDMQRERYATAFESLGLKVHSGDGGFYHWCQLPEGITGDALNKALFPHGAAIIEGLHSDMHRRGEDSPMSNYFRFSFGALEPESFDKDIRVMRDALNSLTANL